MARWAAPIPRSRRSPLTPDAIAVNTFPGRDRNPPAGRANQPGLAHHAEKRTSMSVIARGDTAPSTVIVRESGRSSIPETPAKKWIGRSVLGPPHARGTTAMARRAFARRCEERLRRSNLSILPRHGCRSHPPKQKPREPAPAGFSASVVESASSAPGSPAAAAPRCW